jgi:hypothetical protein
LDGGQEGVEDGLDLGFDNRVSLLVMSVGRGRNSGKTHDGADGSKDVLDLSDEGSNGGKGGVEEASDVAGNMLSSEVADWCAKSSHVDVQVKVQVEQVAALVRAALEGVNVGVSVDGQNTWNDGDGVDVGVDEVGGREGGCARSLSESSKERTTRGLTESEDGKLSEHLEKWVVRRKRVWKELDWDAFQRDANRLRVNWMEEREQEAERGFYRQTV